MKKVHKSILFTTGDASLFEYGGGIVCLVRDTERGTSWITWEWWDGTDGDDEKIEVYRVTVPVDVWKEHNWISMEDETRSGVLSDGKPWSRVDHAKIDQMAETCDIDRRVLIAMGTGSLMDRVQCLETIAFYFGARELDSYSDEYTPKTLRARWRKQWKRFRGRNESAAKPYRHCMEYDKRVDPDDEAFDD